MAHFAPSCLAAQAGEALQDKVWTPDMLKDCINEMIALQKYHLNPTYYLTSIGIQNSPNYYTSISLNFDKSDHTTNCVNIDINSAFHGKPTSSISFSIPKEEAGIKLHEIGLLFMQAAAKYNE